MAPVTNETLELAHDCARDLHAQRPIVLVYVNDDCLGGHQRGQHSESREWHAGIPQKAFRAAHEKAGIDSRLVLYSCRHTFGTYAMAATGNLHGVMRAMGHANVASMLPYQHPGIDQIRDAMDKRNATRESVN